MDLNKSMIIQLTNATTLEVLGVGNAAHSNVPTKYQGRICGRAGGHVYIAPASAFAESVHGWEFATLFARGKVRSRSLENGSRGAFTLVAEASDLPEVEGEGSRDVEFCVDAADVTRALDLSFVSSLAAEASDLPEVEGE